MVFVQVKTKEWFKTAGQVRQLIKEFWVWGPKKGLRNYSYNFLTPCELTVVYMYTRGSQNCPLYNITLYDYR